MNNRRYFSNVKDDGASATQHFEGTIMQKLVIALVAASCFSGATLAQTSPLKIGFVAELSGPQAPLGQDQYDALMMLIEQNGGKLGGVPVQVIKEDSQLKPDVANQVVDKLLEKDRVQIITGVTFSNIMMAVHKKITDKGVFLVGSNAGITSLSSNGSGLFTFA